MPAEIVPIPRRNPARPQQRGDRRREELLGALEHLLADSPLSSISIAEVAREAGVGRSVFYFYFANKQAAVFAMLEDLFVLQAEEITRILGQESDRRENMAVALGQTVQLWRDHRALMLAALEARATDEESSRAWERWIEQYVGFLAEHIEGQRVEGLAPPGPDAESLARVLIAANERMLERHLRREEDEEAAVELHRILVHVWTRSIYDSSLEES